jgi:hypothetical protein
MAVNALAGSSRKELSSEWHGSEPIEKPEANRQCTPHLPTKVGKVSLYVREHASRKYRKANKNFYEPGTVFCFAVRQNMGDGWRSQPRMLNAHCSIGVLNARWRGLSQQSKQSSLS